MSNSRGAKAAVIISISALILTGALTLRAQVRTSSLPALDLSPLQLVDSNAIPAFGNFYFAQNYGITHAPGLAAFGPPLPADFRPDLPLYALGNGNYVIDNYDDTAAAAQSAGSPLSRGGMMSMAEDDSGNTMPMASFSTAGLWLEMAGVTNGLAYLNLYNPTNQVYEILTKTDLSLPTWTIENEVWPTNSSVMPFNISELGRTNLFVWAMDWTGVTENGNTTPDWWFWEYFGTTDWSDNSPDSRGNSLLDDYQNGLDPNIIGFSINVTNQFVRTSLTSASLSVGSGEPFNVSLLLDDTNLADACWVPFTNSTVALNLGSTQGWHSVCIGLTGHATNSTPSWQSIRLKYDPTLPVLTITNPVPGVVTVPMIELQGYSSKPLTAISYDLNNAAGSVSGQQVLVLDQYYDTNTWEYTTSTFQAFDVPVTNGLNVITLHAKDLAGNTTSAIYNYTLDYSTKTNPPLVKLYWPQNQTAICISNYTWRGWVSDFTATVVAQSVDSTGNTNVYFAEVGRDGNFWVENMALPSGTNYLTLAVTDAAGNVTMTNITVASGFIALNINPPASDQLWSNAIPVTGTISDSSDYTVWVNGVKATLNGDGTWTANNVYLPTGGTAVLQARAIPNSDNGGNGTGGTGGGPVSYDSLGNPSSYLAQDTDTQEDKPVRLYVSSYFLNETGSKQESEYFMDAGGNPVIPFGLSSTWEWDKDTGTTSGNWGDGSGGSANSTWQEISTNMLGSGSFNDSNNVTYKSTTYPDVEIATQDEGNDDHGNPMPIILEYCDISTPVTDHTGSALVPPEYFDGANYDLQTMKDTESRYAKATIMLYTGGKGVPGHESLFGLSATAGNVAFCKDPPPMQLYYSCAPSSPIPPTSIRLGELGYLGSDGNLFVALPDNVTKNVTPTVSGSQYYTFNMLATPYQLVLAANGLPLAASSASSLMPEFCVGQAVQLVATWAPPLPAGTQSTYEWVATLDYVDKEVPGNGDASPLYEMDASLETNSIWNLWWYSGGVSDVFCSTANVFPNGQIVSLQADGYVSIYRPRIVKFVTTPPYVPMVAAGFLSLGNVNTMDGAMSFGAHVSTKASFPGNVNWTQLINRNTTWKTSTAGQYWLDNDLFYNTVNHVIGAPPAHVYINPEGTLTFADSPGVPSAVHVDCADSFETYLVFRPDPQDTSIWVTLAVVNWGWSGAENVWNLTSSSVSGPTDTDSTGFPQWPHTLHTQ